MFMEGRGGGWEEGHCAEQSLLGYYVVHVTHMLQILYHKAGIFGEELNLTVWRSIILLQPPN